MTPQVTELEQLFPGAGEMAARMCAFDNRELPREKVYITWTFTPILRADGRRVEGIFNPCSETTDVVEEAGQAASLSDSGCPHHFVVGPRRRRGTYRGSVSRS